MNSNWSELDFIKTLSEKEIVPDDRLVLGIGDDCAILNPDVKTHCLVTTDMLVEGVHFDLSWHPPEKLGQKCIAVNLSDIAAMGGVPRFAFISIAIPDKIEEEWLTSWSHGVMSMLNEHNCKLVGGDTVKGQSLTVNITVFGDIEKNRAICRNNARPGQSIFISGPIGSAAAGLELFLNHQEKSFFNDTISAPFKKQHLSPVPEVVLGRWLSKSMVVTAMQDVSDGIATDLAHICNKSGVKAVIDEKLLPHHQDLPEISTLIRRNMTDLQISGGEDYRLVFTVAEGKDSYLLEMLAKKGIDRVCRIGRIEEGTGVVMKTKNADRNISFKGFEHHFPGD